MTIRPQSLPGVSVADCWVVVPAYNEASQLGNVLDALLEQGYTVIVVDDGSTDETYTTAAKRAVHLLRHELNLGQGAALQTGMAYALREGARWLVMFDADGQHRVEDIAALLEPLLAGRAQVALGTRFGRAACINIPRARRFILWVATLLTRLKTGLRITDTHNGLRAFTAEAAARIRITQNQMAHASEILEIIARESLPYEEVDVSISYTEYSLRKGQKLSASLDILVEWMLGKIR